MSAAKAKRRLEDQLQRAVVDLLRVYEAQGRLLYFAVPNGGMRSKTEAAIMKGLGVRAGVPDICVFMRDATVVFLELKSPTGRVTPHQQAWLDALRAQRHSTAVIRDVDEVPYVLGFKQRRTA